MGANEVPIDTVRSDAVAIDHPMSNFDTPNPTVSDDITDEDLDKIFTDTDEKPAAETPAGEPPKPTAAEAPKETPETSESVDIPGLGNVDKAEIVELRELASKVDQLEEFRQTLEAKRTELLEMEKGLAEARSFQRVLQYPGVAQKLKELLPGLMQDPGNPDPANADSILRALEDPRYSEDRPRIQKALEFLEGAQQTHQEQQLDNGLKEIRDEFDGILTPELEKEVLKTALDTYGKDLTVRRLKAAAASVLTPKAKEYWIRKGEEAALEKIKSQPGTQVVAPSASKAEAAPSEKDPLKMQEAEIDAYIAERI